LPGEVVHVYPIPEAHPALEFKLVLSLGVTVGVLVQLRIYFP
jgi:hypothetical protein